MMPEWQFLKNGIWKLEWGMFHLWGGQQHIRRKTKEATNSKPGKTYVIWKMGAWIEAMIFATLPRKYFIYVYIIRC